MSLPAPARTALGSGVLGLALVVLNQLSAEGLTPPLERAGVLASLLAVGLMLVGVLWTRATPEAAARAALPGDEGLVLAEALPAEVAEELGWGSQMLLTATPAAVVLVQWRGETLLRRGLLTATPFHPGAICARALARQQPVSLVNLRLYPGRAEFETLLPGLPAVVVQPLGEQGLLLVGGWSVRCFSRSDLTWLEGWAQRLTTRLERVQPDRPAAGPEPPEAAAGS
ncbi:cofactor assembly of complex C subunit B [Cyanobium sp. NIES-981]|uniref:cofactor assembly of complex C subunit B n=1 Tax=Cyanobium sp. NIES-981 TaxID=1851505 RepID=UPI0007DD6BF5|nr:cofactor assembly of complex C subunit B [Cyanobium sp. NIES-981]SBO42300.1 conserved protein of unknown function [Cyanobium sp. NIES-981]